MSKQSITLKIAGKQYPLSVDARQEELYRMAERELNERFSRIEKAKFKDFKRDDCLALAALQISFDFIETRLSRSLGDEQVEQLAELDSKLDQYLNQLD
ncbi:MAG: cell division protein ZapA [Rikenellaceae bacterium]|nr:cell division protein ZapA [Rikenellaceae bacterium]MBQ9147587.1 cell division protein ZapA [Rikenellaceae bacterium]MBR2049727.1 cell division protein ZapA [Rikenellaceae bacterium]MBR2419648.1 cell division protein ZapA [Rikenellaceae bacterium]MBR2932478.1 cell division protein ZapA [Rikenellaceae bacterium]